MAHAPRPESSSAPRPASARARLRRAAAVLAHVCGLTLHMKRYIEKSRAEEWALFYLSLKNHSANELLFDMSNYSKYSLSKDFEKLKTLLFIQPKQRSQANLREIQLYLKKNRSFHSLPKEIQLQLCQAAIYQEFEAESMLLRQGHVPLECYLILAGHLKVTSSNTRMNKNTNSKILSEVEEGDFIGETCLLTNTNRPASIFCKTDVKVLVISKEDFYCILAQRVQEQCQETCSFLRNLPLFFSWPKEKIDFLVHCSLRRYYRAGTTIISDNLNSHFLVFIISGRCRIIAQVNYEEISVHSCVMKSSSATLKNAHTVLPSRGTLDVTGRSLKTSTVSPKTSFSAAREKTLDMKKSPLQTHTAWYYSARTWYYRMMKNFIQVEHYGSKKQIPLTPPPLYQLLSPKQILPVGFRIGTALQDVMWKKQDCNEINSNVGLVFQRRLKFLEGKDHLIYLSHSFSHILNKDFLIANHFHQISEGVECVFIPKHLFLAEASAEFRRTAPERACGYPSEEAVREHVVEQRAWAEYKAGVLARQLRIRS